jgi:cobalamin synthase
LAGGIPGILSVACAFIFGILIRLWIKKNFGGITGDLLGFTNETIECLLLSGFAIILHTKIFTIF